MSDNRVSECETWPHGGSPPDLRYLAGLAATFGHGCTPAQLVDSEIDEAARLLGDAGEIAAPNSSARLVGMVKQTRAALQPWQDSRAVRDLDDRLAAYGLV